MLASKFTSVKCSTSEHFICPSFPLTPAPFSPYCLAILLSLVFPFEVGALLAAPELVEVEDFLQVWVANLPGGGL